MKPALALLAMAVVLAGCISKQQDVAADHVVADNGTIPLAGIHSLRFQMKDGFVVSTSGGLGELTVTPTTVCGPLSLYRSSKNAPLPSWAPPAGEFRSYLPVDCIDRNNIAGTTMTVQRTDIAASTMCVALLPLCVLAHSVPGQ